MPEPLTTLAQIAKYSKAMRLADEDRFKALALRLANGEMSLAQWQLEMKNLIREVHAMQFVVGKGGDRSLIRAREYLALGPQVRKQYRHLRNFAKQVERAVEQGRGLGWVTSRAALYARSSEATMWRSAMPVKLPQVPRDGNTRCRSNCKCQLRIVYDRNAEGQRVGVNVYWRLRPAEHCEDCIALSREWNPLRLPITESLSSVEQGVGLMFLESDLSHEDQHAIMEMYELEGGEVWTLHG